MNARLIWLRGRSWLARTKIPLRGATAAELADDDPEIAYDALYAAARKALTAVLQQQGLRPTQAGGHEAVIQAAGALSADDVRSDLPFAAAIVDAAARIVPQMSVFIPTR